jgi:DUF4097 and DUF4098 domain-containing protein YvlB
MKKFIVSGLALFIVFVSVAQESAPYMTKSYKGVKRVKSSTSGGNISVTGGNVTEAKVDVYIRGNQHNEKLSQAEIKERMDNDYDLVMETQGDLLVLTAKSKKNNNWKNGLSVSFSVVVPRASSTDLTTSGGNINLKGLEGKQDFTTSGGNLTLADLKGNIKGRTSGGNINGEKLSDNVDLVTSGGSVDISSAKGDLKFSTSGGNVHLEGLEGTIDASTSGGNVTATNLKGEIDASTSGGNVDMDRISGSLKAGTSGGSVRVSMDAVDKYVKLNNSGGRVDLVLPAGKGYDLDIRGSRVKTSTLTNYSGSVTEERLNGKVNGGGASVTIDNGGNVNLSFH